MLSNSLILIKNLIEKISIQKKPQKVYFNLKLERSILLKDHRLTKSGIYCIMNKLNGKIYIGSTKNINLRMKNYLNNSYLIYKKNSNQPVINSGYKGLERLSFLIFKFL